MASIALTIVFGLLGIGINIMLTMNPPTSERIRKAWIAVANGCFGLALLTAIQAWSPIVLRWPVAWRDSAVTESQTSTEWPRFSGSEISDWAAALRSFPTPVTIEINYSSEQDQAFITGILEVEKELKWSYAGAALGGVMSGIYLTAGKDHEGVARELKALIEKKTNTRVELTIAPNSGADLHLYVGRKPPT